MACKVYGRKHQWKVVGGETVENPKYVTQITYIQCACGKHRNQKRTQRKPKNK